MLLPPASPDRRHKCLAIVLPVALVFLYGCSDAPSPVEPHVFPSTPHALVGPIVTVTNTDDAGAGSLRQAILDAPAGAIIQFDGAIAGETIVLSTGELEIDKVLTIEGPVPAGMTISGGLSSRVFYVASAGDAVLRNLSIVDGREDFGGGIYVSIGKLTLDHALVANNEAVSQPGGGIRVDDGDLTLVNSTVSGNSTSSTGGGIAGSGSYTIRNSTIAFNTAEDGGGVFIVNVPFSIRNSIIANNVGIGASSSGKANCVIKSDTPVFSGRNISNDQSCGTDPTMIIADPKLQPLAGNGGPTRTHALRFGSAVDAGVSCTEATDQRYVVRNQGASCDLGAFEFTDYATGVVTLDPNVAVNAKTGLATVTGTITCSTEAAPTLEIRLSQTQKTTGRFTTIIEAQALVNVPECDASRSSWSVVLTPASGKFAPGSATGTAEETDQTPALIIPSVSAQLKLFQVK